MGLEANATVATGAKPRNNLILLASSGRVENAMNAGKQEDGTKKFGHFQSNTDYLTACLNERVFECE